MTSDAADPAALAGAAPSEAQIQPVSAGYYRYAMVVLLITYVLSFVDRQVVNILGEAIKTELGLMDWQLGLMSGLAFALLYSILGLPIARLAERRNRPAIIAVSLVAWSGFTALCGAAQTFAQLLLARVGVGVGEAGCTPAAHSLIADYAPREKLASALAFYAMGTPLGSLVGMAVGGMVADAYGWRTAFYVCGLPGVAFALVVLFTLREPRRRRHVAAARAAGQPRYLELLKLLLRKPTFRLLLAGSAVKAFVGYGIAPFMASHFLRNHPEQLASLAASVGLQVQGFLGITLGLVSGLGGAAGALLGGFIADRYGRRDLRAWMSVPAVASVLAIPVLTLAVTVPDAAVALVFVFLNAVFASIWYGPLYATCQSVAPRHARATATAILLFVANLVGLGLGPLVIGALSDLFSVGFGLSSGGGVRAALTAAAWLGLAPAWLFWRARRSIRDDMEDQA